MRTKKRREESQKPKHKVRQETSLPLPPSSLGRDQGVDLVGDGLHLLVIREALTLLLGVDKLAIDGDLKRAAYVRR